MLIKIGYYVYNPNKFDKNSCLGGGPFGQVFRCWKVIDHNKPNREEFAIKVIVYRRNAESEIKCFKAMKDVYNQCDFLTNTIAIYPGSTIVYIVSELVEGGDLEDLLVCRQKMLKGKKMDPGKLKKDRQQEPGLWNGSSGMNEDEVCKILYQVMTGLKYMSIAGGGEQQVIHRDLKPANVMYHAGTKTYKICDYGLAKVVGENNKTFTLIGMPLYQAPEIWYRQNQGQYVNRGQHQRGYDASIDTFSVGVMLYELLFLKTPWTTRSPQALMDEMRTEGGIRRWPDLEPNYPGKKISDDLRKLLAKMCTIGQRPTPVQICADPLFMKLTVMFSEDWWLLHFMEATGMIRCMSYNECQVAYKMYHVEHQEFAP